ncbi:hypothetical protein PG991_012143 [Apiospora marii]|uniref:Uncharacterized protein n=1 Tax=Apiospora marii TaxID=335849 RepID=A0ABR1R9S1_9PEZI
MIYNYFLLPFPLSDDKLPSLQQSVWVLTSIRRNQNPLRYDVAIFDAVHRTGTRARQAAYKAERRRQVEERFQHWFGDENVEFTEPEYVHTRVVECDLGVEVINLGWFLLLDADWGYNPRNYAQTLGRVSHTMLRAHIMKTLQAHFASHYFTRRA